MEILRNPDKQFLIQQASSKLKEIILKNENFPILLLLSGGSSLKILDGLEIKGDITIGVLDERYSQDAGINNFSQIMKTNFYKNALVSGSKFIDSRVKEKEGFEEFGRRFENEIIKWVNNKKRKIIITQGIGPDGHTSGIMPYPENPELFDKLFENKEKWVSFYDAGSKNPYPKRVTTTISFLKNMVDHSVVFVAGKDKRDAIERVLDPDGKLNKTPGRIVKGMKAVYLFTDL